MGVVGGVRKGGEHRWAMEVSVIRWGIEMKQPHLVTIEVILNIHK